MEIRTHDEQFEAEAAEKLRKKSLGKIYCLKKEPVKRIYLLLGLCEEIKTNGYSILTNTFKNILRAFEILKIFKNILPQPKI